MNAFVQAIAQDWRKAGLSAVDLALCEFAEKLTRSPGRMGRQDVERLRAAGLDDVAVSDATQVISYFNYINRLAEGLGAEQEDFIREWEKKT